MAGYRVRSRFLTGAVMTDPAFFSASATDAAYELLPPTPDYPRLCHEFLCRAQPADALIHHLMRGLSRVVPHDTDAGKIMNNAAAAFRGHHARSLGIVVRQAGWLMLASKLPGEWLKSASLRRHDDLTVYRADLRAKLLLGFMQSAYASQYIPDELKSREAVHYMHTAKRPYLSQLIAEAL